MNKNACRPRRVFTIVFFACASVLAQMPSRFEMDRLARRSDEIAGFVKNAPLKRFLSGSEKLPELVRYNALRVASDMKDSDSEAPFVWYSVPPLSSIQRLPEQYPVDGKILAPLQVVSMRDEFEPASFVLYPFQDIGAVQVTAGPLRTAGGATLPASEVDVKVVKVWYQNGNGWYSFFADVGLKLVPELLLNDETLVRVDTKRKANYLRLDYPEGPKYIWISAPAAIDSPVRDANAPVYDAKTLQPVSLQAGRFKQFLVTVHVSRDTKPGRYEGDLQLSIGGKQVSAIPVQLRVLPPVLPDPKTYYDLSADFYTMLYGVSRYNGYYDWNGHDRARSDAKQMARFRNQAEHNILYPLYFGTWGLRPEGLPLVEKALRQAREAGMKLDPLFEAFSSGGGNKPTGFYQCKFNAELVKREYGRMLGHTNFYSTGGEEPGYRGVMSARPNWRVSHEAGVKVLCNGRDRRYFAGYNDDFRVGGSFAKKEEAEFMHLIKGKIGNYAGPHTGPENPDYMRRHHGLNLYKKNFDMMYNYAYQSSAWNDLVGHYRNMNVVYATHDDFIDTLAWEGIREGIDDIRYATLLQQLANRLIAEGPAATEKYYAGRKALQFLALLDEETCGLEAARLEMIHHILRLSKLLGEKE